MKECILICDDEKDIVAFLADSLSDDGYKVLTAFNGDQAILKAMEKPDIILLDIMMPFKDGFEVCRTIRNVVNCPIIFLSARQDEFDKVKGLSLGGDDYISKPFSIKELKARIEAHIRRDRRLGNANNTGRLAFGELSIDISERTVYFKDIIISLTRREFDIVEFLASNIGQVFSREQIYEKIWGYDSEGDSSCVSEHIKNIRTKLSSVTSGKEYIKTVWGIGYRWERYN